MAQDNYNYSKNLWDPAKEGYDTVCVNCSSKNTFVKETDTCSNCGTVGHFVMVKRVMENDPFLEIGTN